VTLSPSSDTVPTGAPQNVAVQAATATQLDVTWEPPPAESQNGDIQGYKVPRLVAWELAPSRGSARGGRGERLAGHWVCWEGAGCCWGAG